VDSYIFTQSHTVTDPGVRQHAGFEAVILRVIADNRTEIDTAIPPQRGVAGDFYMSIYNTIIPDNAIFTNDRISSDGNILSDHSSRRDNGCRMDIFHFVPPFLRSVDDRAAGGISGKYPVDIRCEKVKDHNGQGMVAAE